MPSLVACAITHDDPPQVILAEDENALSWALAVHLVAQTPASRLMPGVRDRLREALLAERWDEAVELWMSYSGVVVDIYPSFDVHRADEMTIAAAEVQFTPLFADD